jgi:ATP-dependent protease ClpP protease subunit
VNFIPVIGRILINGHIGPSYVDEKGNLKKGVELIDVIDQVVDQKEATSFEVSIISPGGLVPVGDDIFDYLKDIDKTRPVTTIQKGLVGSIATKIFLAGRFRLVDDRFEFWIHNPYKENVTGDADQLRAEADDTEKTEKEIRKFYGEFSSMGDVAMDALMKQETGLTAEQCIKYGFATGKVQAPVFNIIKTMMNKSEDKSLKEQLLALLGVKPEVKKGNQPKAAIPAGTTEAKKSLIVNLAEGAGKFYVEGEALTEGAAAFTLDEAGQPTAESVQDGVYNLDGGGSVTVQGGKVAKFELPMDPEEEDPEKITEEKIDALVTAKVKVIEEALNKKFADQTLALKKEVKLGVQPKPAVLNGNKGSSTTVYKTLSQIQFERDQEIRNKRN